jgi:NitT/TauT family transport system ATP-binding protein
VDTLYGILTGREEATAAGAAAVEHRGPDAKPLPTPTEAPLPPVSVGGMAGLLEILAGRGGEEGLAEIADALSFEVDDLLPLVDAAELLGLAHTARARITITEAGRQFAAADIDTTKKLFADLAAQRAPLVRAILQALRTTDDGTLREGFFLDLLRRGYSETDARRQLDTAIEWGRYAELFDYHNGELVLEPDAQPPAA